MTAELLQSEEELLVNKAEVVERWRLNKASFPQKQVRQKVSVSSDRRRAALGLSPTFINIYISSNITEATSAGAALNLHTQLCQTGIKNTADVPGN